MQDKSEVGRKRKINKDRKDGSRGLQSKVVAGDTSCNGRDTTGASGSIDHATYCIPLHLRGQSKTPPPCNDICIHILYYASYASC